MNAHHQGQLDFFCAIYAFINAMRLLFGIQLNQSRDILATALREISEHPALWQAVLSNRTDHHWVTAYMLGRFCGPGGFPVLVAELPAAPPDGLAALTETEIKAWLAPNAPVAVSLQTLSQEPLYRPGVEFGPGAAQPPPGVKAPERLWSLERLWALLQCWLYESKLSKIFGAPTKQKRCLLLRFHRFVLNQPQPLISHWSTGQNFSRGVLNLYDCTANQEATRALRQTEVALYPECLNTRRNLALETQSLIFLEKY